MHIRRKNIAGAGLVLAAALAVAAAPVMAAKGGTFRAITTPVQSAQAQSRFSGLMVFGEATLTLNGNLLTAEITAYGLSPSLPHLMHIHGDIGAQNDCPGSEVAGEDGLINTAEGQPAYGPILVTFSTEGSTRASAGLSIETAAWADSNGELTYSRTFRIPGKIVKNISDLHVVIHGADLNGVNGYDGPDGSLGAGIPLEAEIPVSCGAIN